MFSRAFCSRLMSHFTSHESLSSAIYLLHHAVVEELRWLGLFCLRNRLRQEIENPLNPRLRYHQFSPEAGAAIELVGSVQGLGIGFFVVFGDDLDGKTLIAVVPIDARAQRAQ